MAAMYPSDFGSTGSERTSWFQALSAGNTGHGPIEVDPAGAAGEGAGGAGGADTTGAPSGRDAAARRPVPEWPPAQAASSSPVTTTTPAAARVPIPPSSARAGLTRSTICPERPLAAPLRSQIPSLDSQFVP